MITAILLVIVATSVVSLLLLFGYAQYFIYLVRICGSHMYPHLSPANQLKTLHQYSRVKLSKILKIRKLLLKTKYGTDEWLQEELKIREIVDQCCDRFKLPGVNPYVEILGALMSADYQHAKHVPENIHGTGREKLITDSLCMAILKNKQSLPLITNNTAIRLQPLVISRYIMMSHHQHVLNDADDYVRHYFLKISAGPWKI